MSYQYHLDDTSVGDLRLARRKYEVLHRAYRLLRDELDAWNQRVAREISAEAPYRDEVAELDRIIDWGECHHRCQERAGKSAQGWPDAALRSLDDALERPQSIADVFDQEPSEVLWQLIPRNDASGAAMDERTPRVTTPRLPLSCFARLSTTGIARGVAPRDSRWRVRNGFSERPSGHRTHWQCVAPGDRATASPWIRFLGACA